MQLFLLFPVELQIKSGVMCLHCPITALCTHPEECVLRSSCMVCVFGVRVCLQKPEVFTYQSPWSWSYSRFWTSQHRYWELNLVFWKTSKQSTTFSPLQPMIYVCMCFWLPHYQFLCSFYSKHTYHNCHWINFQTMLKFTFIFWLHSDEVLFCNLLKEDHI